MRKMMRSLGVVLVSVCLGHVGFSADFSGIWDGTWYSFDGTSGWMSLDLQQSGTTLSGTLDVQEEGAVYYGIPVTGTVSGNTANITGTFVDSGQTYRIEYTEAQISPDNTVIEAVYYMTENGWPFDWGTFWVSKSGPGGSLTISPSSRSHTSAASFNYFEVMTDMPWLAESDDAWIVILEGASGNGNGTVTYSVASNSDMASRSGTITVSGGGITHIFTVNQAAGSIRVDMTQPSAGAITQTPQTVVYGENATWTLTLPRGYRVKYWLVNGVQKSHGELSHTEQNITGEMAVGVVIQRMQAMPWLNLLLD